MLKNLGVSFLSTCFALLLIEVIVRILAPTSTLLLPGGVTGKAAVLTIESASDSSTENVSGLIAHTAQGLRMRQGVSVIVQNYPLNGREILIRTNSLGLRGPDLAPRDKGRKRVLFLGDSITFGEGVNEEETFVQQTERLYPGLFETVNGAFSGYGTKDELSLLRDIGAATQADTAVLVLYLNDAISSPKYVRKELPFWLAWSQSARLISDCISSLVAIYLQPLQTDISQETVNTWFREAQARTQHPLVIGSLSDWGIAWSDGVWSYIYQLIKQFKEQASQLHMKPLIVMTPVRAQVEGILNDTYPQERLKELAADLNLPTLDLLPSLQREHIESKHDLFYDQCHYTPLGHEVVAKELAEFLKAHL